MTVSPSHAISRSEIKTSSQATRYVSPYKASRVRTAKGKSKSNANSSNMVYTQGAPNIFDSYLNGGDENKSTEKKRVKGSYMQGTIASGKKQ